MKKTLAILLVLALTLATVSVSAFAAPTTSAQGDGTVNFTPGDGPGIIDDPNINTNYNVRGLDFGTHSMDENKADVTYDSLVHARSEAGKTTGVTIENTYTTGWHVNVQRTIFTEAAAPAVEVMNGAVLSLVPTTSTASFPNPNPGLGAQGTTTVSGGEVKIGVDGKVFDAAVNNGIGIWGALWSGTLKVPAFKAVVGDAKSTMTWSVVVGP